MENDAVLNSLKLENQVCFPLYAAAREVIRKYSPQLKPLGLTYTQYIVMMVMWEHHTLSVGELGKKLKLDTGTLSPLLKAMEEKGLVKKSRKKNDERVVSVEISEDGKKLMDKAKFVPQAIRCGIDLTDEELGTLRKLLYRLIATEEKSEK